jgi:uncharacterized membrane protein YgcG
MQHHIHISTGVIFCAVLLVVAILVFVLIRMALKRPRETTRPQEVKPQDMAAPRNSGYAGALSGYHGAPTTTVVHEHYSGGGSGDLLTGVLIGEALSGGHRTEVIHERDSSPAPSTVAPSRDDNSSGGIDISWGHSSSSDSGSGSSYGSSSDSGGGSDFSSSSC